jgi:hypothetical protein
VTVQNKKLITNMFKIRSYGKIHVRDSRFFQINDFYSNLFIQFLVKPTKKTRDIEQALRFSIKHEATEII